MLFEYRVRLWLVEYGSIRLYLILWNKLWFFYRVLFVYGLIYKYIYIYSLLPQILTIAWSLLKRNLPDCNKYSKYSNYSVCVDVSVIECVSLYVYLWFSMCLWFCVSFCVSVFVNVCFVCQCAGGCKCMFVRVSVYENVCKFVPLRALLHMIVYILKRVKLFLK